MLIGVLVAQNDESIFLLSLLVYFCFVGIICMLRIGAFVLGWGDKYLMD